MLAILSSGWHRVADRGLVALRLRGRVTGRVLRLPVQYAGDSAGLVVAPGRPEKKRWWRNLGEPARVEVLLRGRWRTGVGQVLWAGDAGHDMAVATYRVRWPRARLPEDAPVVRIRVDPRAPDP